jgi:pyruvate formate lyase activating enzyme
MKDGLIFDIRRYAVHDGPGIRTTVFFKGCPLHCMWCHNPEGQRPEPELVYRRNRCTCCDVCVGKCERKAISSVQGSVFINRTKCTVCRRCSDVCPPEALAIAGKRVRVEEVLDEIEKDRIFYEESGGGVTFSGGEPLMQPEFLFALLKKCKARAIHNVVDTCGFARYGIIDKIREKVDLFLYDIKTMDENTHRKYTGVSNARILRNLKKIAENGTSIVISFPVIPSINDSDENVTRTADFVSRLPNILQINLLPYHKAGIEKYKNLGKPYKLEKIQPPSDESIASVRERIESFGIRVEIGGG